MATLRSAALHCEFRYLDEMLLDQLVCGVKDLKLQRRLLARSELTLQVVLDEARAAEMSDRSASEIQQFQAVPAPAGKPLSVHYEDSGQDESSDDEERVSRLTRSSSSVIRQKKAAAATLPKFTQDNCWGCGGNHRRADCRFKTAVCHRCGKRGHLSRVCRAANPTSETRAPHRGQRSPTF